MNGRTRNHPSNGREDWAGKQEAARRELVQKVRGNQLQVGRVKGGKKEGTGIWGVSGSSVAGFRKQSSPRVLGHGICVFSVERVCTAAGSLVRLHFGVINWRSGHGPRWPANKEEVCSPLDGKQAHSDHSDGNRKVSTQTGRS